VTAHADAVTRADATRGSKELLARIMATAPRPVAAMAEPETPPPGEIAASVPLGHAGDAEVAIDLGRLLAGRCLIQGSSGAGKSQTLRKIVEEAFEYVTIMLVDPEGEFHNLARHIAATTIRAVELTTEGMTAAAVRGREHRIALHIDLTDLEPDERIEKAAAFFAGLIASPREHWANTVLVCVDEAHLLAPHMAASVRDAETRKLGVASLTDLCSRGRKRGIGTVLATQRLAKLAGSVVSELHNVLIGLNVFDRDVVRAADLLGFDSRQADQLRHLRAGEFFAFGPALCRRPALVHVAQAITEHLGATPGLIGSSDMGADEARALLDLGALKDLGGRRRGTAPMRGGAKLLDAFLLEAAAPAAVRIVDALRKIAPNATTAEDLARHLGLDGAEIDAGLDLVGQIGAVDTMPRGGQRLARLSARMRLRVVDAPVVGLA